MYALLIFTPLFVMWQWQWNTNNKTLLICIPLFNLWFEISGVAAFCTLCIVTCPQNVDRLTSSRAGGQDIDHGHLARLIAVCGSRVPRSTFRAAATISAKAYAHRCTVRHNPMRLLGVHYSHVCHK